MGQRKRVAHAGKISGMNDFAQAKAQLRGKILAERSARTNSETDEVNLTKQLLLLVERTKPTRVATYLSFGSEPSTKLFIKELLNLKIEVLVPKVTGEELTWFRFDGLNAVSSALGMQEPDESVLERSALQQTDLLLIPALAVDRSGNRLGRGKGYFDRALLVSAIQQSHAICYESEFLETLPSEDHDQRVQTLVTEQAIHDLN
jgi:5-formyltetrahydrofolate cyclo-ligase